MKSVLILSSSFPGYEGEPDGNFLYELSINLAKTHNIFVNTPYKPGSKNSEKMSSININRYKYFYPNSLHKLAGGSGLRYNFSKSILAKIQLPFFILFQIISTLLLIKKNKISIINSHWVVPQGISGVIAKIVYGTKHVIMIHGSDINIVKSSKLLKFISNIIFKYSDVIIVNSSYTKSIVEKHLSAYKNKLRLIPMGVDPSKFSFQSRDLKNKKLQEFMILGVGVLIDWKGFKYLIHAFKEILKNYPNSKLTIIGDGVEKDNLIELSKKLNIDEKIKFLGWIKNNEIVEYYKKNDIFVIPSINLKGKTEGLGIVTMEAMCTGLPVVGSDVGGIPDVIKDGVNGFLVPAKSSQDIAKKIIKILDDEDLYQKFSKNGRMIIENSFSWKSISSQFSNIFSRV